MAWEQVGEVGVDAGLMWLGDPCYIMGEGRNRDYDVWEKFCDTISKTLFPTVQQFYFDKGHAGLGVCVSTGYGDGTYPVEVKRNDEGRIAAVRIVFISEDED